WTSQRRNRAQSRGRCVWDRAKDRRICAQSSNAGDDSSGYLWAQFVVHVLSRAIRIVQTNIRGGREIILHPVSANNLTIRQIRILRRPQNQKVSRQSRA